jgi:hypothetical protein
VALCLATLVVWLTGCQQRPASTPDEFAQLLAQVPAGTAVFWDAMHLDEAPPHVRAVPLPTELSDPRDVPADVTPTSLRAPHPPEPYADAVDYLLLPADGIVHLLGCARAAWERLGSAPGPRRRSYELWRRQAVPPAPPNWQPARLLPVANGAFQIEETEVTYARYVAFLSKARPSESQLAEWIDLGRPDNPLVRDGDGYAVADACGSHPVAFVSYAGAAAYCAHLGRRLPNDSEWEAAACRPGAADPWAEDADAQSVANLAGEADGYAHSSPVGAFPKGKSLCGALDLAGNAFEWTAGSSGAALRGGSWATGPEWAKCAARESNAPIVRNNHNGFRCAQ